MMKAVNAGKICYYQFKSFQAPGIFHGIFTRKGGVSPKPWQSLNLGGTVGDSSENVRENLQRLMGTTGFSEEKLVQVRQVHSAKVIRADMPVDAKEQGDAMTTDKTGLLLLMRFADCVPILFVDPQKRVIAIAHAGWKGTLKGIAFAVVEKMRAEFDVDAGNLFVGIGPSIGPDHYQVGSDVIRKTEQVFPGKSDQVLREGPDGVKLDLWKANELHLRRAGVERIEIAGLCTGCDIDQWYSHREEKGSTGRFAAVIGIHED